MLIEVTDLNRPELLPYSLLTGRDDNALAQGLFIAESPKVIETAIRQGYAPVSFLTERKHIDGDAAHAIAMAGPDVPVFVGERHLLALLTGYTLTRGVLCAMRRPQFPTPEDTFAGARRIAVIDRVCDTTNIGAIFRSAAALGIDAIGVVRGSCDPLNRRAVRVSMGAVFMLPWTWIDNSIDSLRPLVFDIAAMALTDRSITPDSLSRLNPPRLAIVLGSEGYGLSDDIINRADYVVKIPMARGVDSLNVAAASAVMFWQLRVDAEQA